MTDNIFLNCAASRTQAHVIKALAARGANMRAFARNPDSSDFAARGVAETRAGSMTDIDALAEAMQGCETVIHVAPALQVMETAMGQIAIDAAKRAGVRRFIYLSVINPQIDYLMNHRAKLAVEDYLIGSGLAWTILQPQHYFQNLDLENAIPKGLINITYSIERPLGFVDMADVGEVAAKVATEAGHEYATYALAGPDYLTGHEIADIVGKIAGKPMRIEQIPLAHIVKHLAPVLAASAESSEWTAGAIERLFLYYDRFGIRGNSGILSWLLGRPAANLADVARRALGS